MIWANAVAGHSHTLAWEKQNKCKQPKTKFILQRGSHRGFIHTPSRIHPKQVLNYTR